MRRIPGIAALLFLAACAAGRAETAWMPRKIHREPIVHNRVSHSQFAPTAPVQRRRANTSRRVTRRSLTPMTSRIQHYSKFEWENAYGASSVEYKAYDTLVTDASRAYDKTPGIDDGNSPGWNERP